jgi:hypothetical protein
MKIIEKNFTGVITPKLCNREHILNVRKKSQEVVDMTELYAGLLESRRSPEIYQPILEAISDDIGVPLTFKSFESTYIVARSPKDKEYIIVGSWHSCGYQFVLQSCLRRKPRCEKAFWQLDGSASQGTELIKFYGEQTQILIPEFKIIMDNFVKHCV